MRTIEVHTKEARPALECTEEARTKEARTKEARTKESRTKEARALKDRRAFKEACALNEVPKWIEEARVLKKSQDEMSKELSVFSVHE